MIVELEAVEKSFIPEPGAPPLRVLSDLSFRVEEGEFLCLIGPSGCGKSTLLALLAGLELPDAGCIRFVGNRASAGPITTIVWQDYALVPWRSILDNVAFGLELRRVSKRKRYAIARQHLEMLGIGDFEKVFPSQLSGGMRQRAGIARALANDPEVLLMDEPFAAVDAQTRLTMQEELLELWERERKTVVFITHNIEEALLLGDRVLVLSARPAAVVEEIHVPFPRPRGMHTEAIPRFSELKQHIWELLRQSTPQERRQAS